MAPYPATDKTAFAAAPAATHRGRLSYLPRKWRDTGQPEYRGPRCPTQKTRRSPDAKRIDTQGYSCPHPDCKYFWNTDAAVHALTGYTCTALRAAQGRCGHHPVVCPAERFVNTQLRR